MDEISSTEFDRLRRQSGESIILVRCKTEPVKGTSCTVDGKKVTGGIVEAVEEGKKVAGDRGAKAYFQNKSCNVFWPMEEFIESCPKLAREIDLVEKIRWVKISAVLIGGIAFLVLLWAMF